MRRVINVTLLVLVAAALSPFRQAATVETKPNIVFILVEYVGWGDLGGWYDAHATNRQALERGHSLQQLQRRSPMHP
jgi:hypothetical protein